MPYLPSAQSFLEESRLLISARPTTTKISTKYTLHKPSPSRQSSKSTSKTVEQPPQDAQSQPPKATLTLKTYDPVSGTCLKYETDKAAEVGRLVATLSTCGRIMAALPDQEEAPVEAEENVKDEPETKTSEAKGKASTKDAGKDTKSGVGKGGDKGGGGAPGKKKKGKR